MKNLRFIAGAILITQFGLFASQSWATPQASCEQLRREKLTMLRAQLEEDRGAYQQALVFLPLNTGLSIIGLMLTSSVVVVEGLDVLYGTGLSSTGGVSMSAGLGGVIAFFQANERYEDSLRAYRASLDYRCIVSQLGRARAEEFLADVLAEWDAIHLARKYLSPEELRQIEAIKSEIGV